MFEGPFRVQEYQDLFYAYHDRCITIIDQFERHLKSTTWVAIKEEITKKLSHDNYGLIIKMSVETFNELKNNEKHPEDLMFEEKIKISGDLKLLQQ